jgi:hypothetical protein
MHPDQVISRSVAMTALLRAASRTVMSCAQTVFSTVAGFVNHGRHIHTPARMASSAGAVATTGVAAGAAALAASADPVPPEHAIIVCQSASFYDNVPSSGGRLIHPLSYGDKVGHTRGAHPVYNGWAATFDFGPNDWGYVRYECLGSGGSW